jgi:hypothetical protein
LAKQFSDRSLGQVNQGAKAQAHQFFVQGIELAQGGNMITASKNLNGAGEGATSGNQMAKPSGKLAIANFDLIQPLTERKENINSQGLFPIGKGIAMEGKYLANFSQFKSIGVKERLQHDSWAVKCKVLSFCLYQVLSKPQPSMLPIRFISLIKNVLNSLKPDNSRL